MPRPSLLQAVIVLLVAMLGLMAVSAAYRARTQRSTTTTAVAQPARPAPAAEAAVPAAPAAVRAAPPLDVVGPQKPAASAKPAPKPQPKFEVAHVRTGHTLALRSKPGGPVLARVPATTQFGSPTTLAVAATRGNWVGLTSTDLPNGKLGWVRRSHQNDFRTTSTHLSIQVDLSARKLELRDGRKVVRRVTVGIGLPGSPTPTGRFSITDKLPGATYSAVYGCCILALSGHQGHTPAGWQGGNRLAIHGTSNPGTIGVPSSAGCLHADAEDLHALMRRVPLGTPVFIHA